MTVYVDIYPKWLPVGPVWEGGGHLFGTDLEELHKFAKSLGLKREYYQGTEGKFPHYDLTQSKRSLALRKGAIRVAPGLIPEGVIRHDPNQST